MKTEDEIRTTSGSSLIFGSFDEAESGKRPLSKTLAVRFDEQTMELLQAAAESRGIGPTTLVRQWIQERLGIDWQVGALAQDRYLVPEGVESAMRARIVDLLMDELPNVAESALAHAMEKKEQDA